MHALILAFLRSLPAWVYIAILSASAGLITYTVVDSRATNRAKAAIELQNAKAAVEANKTAVTATAKATDDLTGASADELLTKNGWMATEPPPASTPPPAPPAEPEVKPVFPTTPMPAIGNPPKPKIKAKPTQVATNRLPRCEAGSVPFLLPGSKAVECTPTLIIDLIAAWNPPLGRSPATGNPTDDVFLNPFGIDRN